MKKVVDRIVKNVTIKNIDTEYDTTYNISRVYSKCQSGINYTFQKPGCQPITIPKHEPIKKVYVEMVKQIVEGEAKNDENVG